MSADDLASTIGEDFRPHVSVQDYGAKPCIDGVQILDLRSFADDGGSFNELLRLREDGTIQVLPEFHVRQASFSEVLPGAIKAWHLHRSQEDLWFVPPSDRLLVGLLDVRAGSPTYRCAMRFVMGGGSARLAYIPAGVAHGVTNLGRSSASIIYFVSAQFDPVDPDELRLPWDEIGADFWQIQQG